MNLLIVEDDAAIAEGLAETLRAEGHEVAVASTGEEALRRVAAAAPDLMVLDLNLPGMDGLDVLQHVRSRGAGWPVLILSARSLELDKVRGLDRGADDYLTKPFGLAELLARIRALLRRGAAATAVERVAFGDVIVDLVGMTATRKGRPLALTTREIRLIEYFHRHRGQVLSREQILEALWGRSFGAGTRTVDVHLAKLRKKVEPDPEHPQHILTVRSAGYKFEP